MTIEYPAPGGYGIRNLPRQRGWHLVPRRKACDHAPEGSVSESAVSRNTRSSERRNIPEAGRPEEPGRCKLPLARSLQLRSVRRQHRNSFEMPHFRFLIRADSVRVFFFCLVIIKTAPICGAKGDEHHAEYSSVTPPNSSRVARKEVLRGLVPQR